MTTDYVQVLTTAGSEEEAERIASMLVDRRLAACVQVIGPIVSRYRWRGAVEREREWQCLAKTERDRFPDVERAIRAAHSYEEPEILAIPVLDGSAGYLAWISESLRPDWPAAMPRRRPRSAGAGRSDRRPQK